ncbi:hypothetical protein, partial [Xanthomonas graminis]|uniref:hypothetical protein n=1 Tax=Xanthomonas graminis TaxID=3390026 RepID=UPI001E39F5A0
NDQNEASGCLQKPGRFTLALHQNRTDGEVRDGVLPGIEYLDGQRCGLRLGDLLVHGRFRLLHGLYYRHKEKKDGRFRPPGVALGAAHGRAPGA